MKKNKVFILGCMIGVAVIASLCFLLANISSKPIISELSSDSIKISMTESYNPDKVPPSFGINEYTNTAKKIGINNKAQLIQGVNSISVNQNLKKDGDYFVGAGGTITLTIGGNPHKLIIQSSYVTHDRLKNGQNFLTGTFETEMNDENDKAVSTTVTFASLVETGEEFFYVTIGTLEEGPIVLPYGDDSFATAEMKDIVGGQANFE